MGQAMSGGIRPATYEEELVRSRQLFLTGEVTMASADVVIRQALYLKAMDPEGGIVLNIMSPGGEVAAGLALIDALASTGCEVTTVGYGMCASMAAHLLACCGAHGRRYVTPNCSVLLHQVMGGTSGQQTDIEIAAEQVRHMRARLDGMLARACGTTAERIHAETERDHWLTAEEAVAFGLADHVLGGEER